MYQLYSSNNKLYKRILDNGIFSHITTKQETKFGVDYAVFSFTTKDNRTVKESKKTSDYRAFSEQVVVYNSKNPEEFLLSDEIKNHSEVWHLGGSIFGAIFIGVWMHMVIVFLLKFYSRIKTY